MKKIHFKRSMSDGAKVDTVGSGALFGICVVIKIIKEFKEIFKNGKEE